MSLVGRLSRTWATPPSTRHVTVLGMPPAYGAAVDAAAAPDRTGDRFGDDLGPSGAGGAERPGRAQGGAVRVVAAVDEHRDAEDAQAERGEPDTDDRGGGVAVPGGDDDATDPRAERVGEVERGVVAGRGEGLRGPGHLHEPQLEVDDEHRREHRDEREDDERRHGVGRDEGEQRQRDAEPGHADDDRADDRPVPHPPGDEVADEAEAPKTRRNIGTADAGSPVTSVTVGAM